jgi:hypothetical protein
MTNFILIFVYLFFRIGFAKVKWIPASLQVLNKIAINFCLPFSFVLYTKIQWNNDYCILLVAAWFWSFVFILLFFLGKSWSKKLTGCLILTAGLSILSFRF